MPDNISSRIVFSMSEDGELFMDINLEDYSDTSIDNFAKMISSLGTIQLQLEALEMATSGLMESIPNKVDPFLTKVTELTTDNFKNESSSIFKKGQEEEPCIKPSDLF